MVLDCLLCAVLVSSVFALLFVDWRFDVNLIVLELFIFVVRCVYVFVVGC